MPNRTGNNRWDPLGSQQTLIAKETNISPSSRAKKSYEVRESANKFTVRESANKFAVSGKREFNRVDVHWQNDVIAFDAKDAAASKETSGGDAADATRRKEPPSSEEVFYYYDESQDIPTEDDEDYTVGYD